ncbi:MAG: hypothetical protein CME01_03645 [Geminicoccus sp.]|nr:hypothetical protein [Geminicoccus sp.]
METCAYRYAGEDAENHGLVTAMHELRRRRVGLRIVERPKTGYKQRRFYWVATPPQPFAT